MKTVILCAVAILSAMGAGHEKARAADLYMTSQTGAEGSVVRFDLNVGNAPNDVAAFGFEVEYDATVLSYRDYETGPLVGGFTNFNVNNAGFGQVRIGGFDTGDHVIPSGESGFLVGLTFEVSGQDDCQLVIRDLMDDMKDWRAGNGVFTGQKKDVEETSDEGEADKNDETETGGETGAVSEIGNTYSKFGFRQDTGLTSAVSKDLPGDNASGSQYLGNAGSSETAPVRITSTVPGTRPNSRAEDDPESRERRTVGAGNSPARTPPKPEASPAMIAKTADGKTPGKPKIRQTVESASPVGRKTPDVVPTSGSDNGSKEASASLSVSPMVIILVAVFLIQLLVLIRFRFIIKE